MKTASCHICGTTCKDWEDAIYYMNCCTSCAIAVHIEYDGSYLSSRNNGDGFSIKFAEAIKAVYSRKVSGPFAQKCVAVIDLGRGMPKQSSECPCGINRSMCDYHKP